MAVKGTVVITGAANGIGQALAVEAAARGARIVAIDRYEAEETTAKVRNVGGEIESFVCDIADSRALATIAGQIADRMGEVNYVLANVGMGVVGSLESIPFEDFAKVVEVNLLGTFYTVRAFLPLVRTAAEEGDAAIVITGSEHSLGVPPNQQNSAYTVAKHSLLGLADVLRKDLDGSGIGVTLLAPGWTLTPAVSAYLDSDPQASAAIRPIAQKPEEVASIAWDAIEAKAFLVPTNTHSREIVATRVADLQRGFDAF